MTSTNPILALYSTVQTNAAGSTITTGFIPYISTAGRQGYTNTLSSLTISSLITTTLPYPISTLNVATTAYVSSATGTLLTTTNTWAASNTFYGAISIPSYGNLTSTISSLSARIATLEATTMKQNVYSYMTGNVTAYGRNEFVAYYLSDAYWPTGAGGSWYGNQWFFYP